MADHHHHHHQVERNRQPPRYRGDSRVRLLRAPELIFETTAEGVWLRTQQAMFHLKGQQIGAWLERLLPFFDGRRPLCELCEPLDEPRRAMVLRLVDSLVERGALLPVSAEDEGWLSADERRRFAPQLQFLASLEEDPAACFARFRATRCQLLGDAGAASSVAAALQRLGLQSPTVLAEPAVDGADVVLYCAGRRELTELQRVHSECRRRGIPFLASWVDGHELVVGPWMEPSTSGCWECLRARWTARLEKPESSRLRTLRRDPGRGVASGSGDSLVAWIAFQHLTGCVDRGGARLWVRDLATWETTLHPLIPAPACGGCRAAPEDAERLWPEKLAADGDPAEAGDLLAEVERLANERTGIFQIEDGKLRQLPLFRSRWWVLPPGGPRIAVSGASELGLQGARFEAARAALCRYALAVWDVESQGVEGYRLRTQCPVRISAAPLSAPANSPPGGIAAAGSLAAAAAEAALAALAAARDRGLDEGGRVAVGSELAAADRAWLRILRQLGYRWRFADLGDRGGLHVLRLRARRGTVELRALGYGLSRRAAVLGAVRRVIELAQKELGGETIAGNRVPARRWGLESPARLDQVAGVLEAGGEDLVLVDITPRDLVGEISLRVVCALPYPV